MGSRTDGQTNGRVGGQADEKTPLYNVKSGPVRQFGNTEKTFKILLNRFSDKNTKFQRCPSQLIIIEKN